jgi:hypothetical protein
MSIPRVATAIIRVGVGSIGAIGLVFSMFLVILLVGFYALALGCDYTGWCRVEDYITM